PGPTGARTRTPPYVRHSGAPSAGAATRPSPLPRARSAGPWRRASGAPPGSICKEATVAPTTPNPRGQQRKLALPPAARPLALPRWWCRHHRHADRDQADSDALYGLVKAVRSHDPARGATLAVWVGTIVRGRLLDGHREVHHGRRRHGHGRTLSLHSVVRR